jgi:hypothetical protein
MANDRITRTRWNHRWQRQCLRVLCPQGRGTTNCKVAGMKAAALRSVVPGSWYLCRDLITDRVYT